MLFIFYMSFFKLVLIWHHSNVSSEKDEMINFDVDHNDADQVLVDESCTNFNWHKIIVWARRGQKCCPKSSTCYRNDKDTPWKSLPHLPDCPEHLAPQFLVFTQENDDSQAIEYVNFERDVKSLNLTNSSKFFAIVHGYRTKNWKNNWLLILKDLLIQMGHNVMLVKWLNGSNDKDYSKAASNTRAVGDSMKKVLDEMIANGKIALDQITLIGFSLGAHICGYVGSLFDGLLPRILALDPAGPLFACQNESIRLDPSDARFVQVIHTNGDSLSRGGLGALQRMGHVDFYPNGGVTQPGCEPPTFSKVITFRTSLKKASCSHRVAPMILVDILKRSLSKQLIINSNRTSPSNDICKFQTFACPNADQWKAGRCFRKCPTVDHCSEPAGLDFLFSTNDRPKISNRGIYFGTLAYKNGDDSMEFCGRQHLVTMLISTKKVKGSIKIRFYDQNFGWSTQSEFQDKNAKSKHNSQQSTVITSEWLIKNISKVEIAYTRYEGKFSSEGVKRFTLDWLSVDEVSGLRKKSIDAIDIFHKTPKIVDLM